VKKIHAGDTKHGVNFTALREIKALRDAVHENVVRLADVFVRSGSVHLVFEHCDSDLEKVINDQHHSIVITEPHVKAYAQMMLRAVAFLHARWFVHRDIKPSNLLVRYDPVTHASVLKLSDFGLCRTYAEVPDVCFTPGAVTRWYRPPEMLLGADRYGAAVDMWSCGCIVAQLFLRTPLFAGDTELQQLDLIFQALGVPTEATWPGVTHLPGFELFRLAPGKDAPAGTLSRSLFSAASDAAFALITKLLSLDPMRRGSAQEALAHPFFTTGEPPTPPAGLPKPPMKDDGGGAKRAPPLPDGAEPAPRRRLAFDTATPDPIARNKFLEQLEAMSP
jgi:cyclin-dependent kinase 7